MVLGDLLVILATLTLHFSYAKDFAVLFFSFFIILLFEDIKFANFGQVRFLVLLLLF